MKVTLCPKTHQMSSNKLVNNRETSSRAFTVAYSTNTQLYVAIHCGLLRVISPDLLQIGISVEISFWDLRCLTHFRVLQHDHEIVVRGISLQKPSVHYSGRPQCEGELWSRLRMPPTIEKSCFLRNYIHRGQAGGSLRWSEGLA